MSEQDKRAEEVWEQACGRMLDELAVGDIAAALSQARREGYLDGIAAARDVCERGHGHLLA